MPRKIAKKTSERWVGYVLVTPEMAAEFLQNNRSNRKNVRWAQVLKYAAMMKSGTWGDGDSALCFSPEGEMLNGQHRCFAIIEAGVSVMMLVQRNVPVSAILNMDAGVPRNFADALHFQGETSTNQLAAAIRLASMVSDGTLRPAHRTLAPQPVLLQFLEDNPELRESVRMAQSVHKQVDCSGMVLSVAHWMIARKNGSELADAFLRAMSLRIGEPEGSVILAMDSRLRVLSKHKSQIETRELLTFVLRGWNHWVVDTRVKQLPLRLPGPFQLPEVAIHRSLLLKSCEAVPELPEAV